MFLILKSCLTVSCVADAESKPRSRQSGRNVLRGTLSVLSFTACHILDPLRKIVDKKSDKKDGKPNNNLEITKMSFAHSVAVSNPEQERKLDLANLPKNKTSLEDDVRKLLEEEETLSKGDNSNSSQDSNPNKDLPSGDGSMNPDNGNTHNKEGSQNPAHSEGENTPDNLNKKKDPPSGGDNPGGMIINPKKEEEFSLKLENKLKELQAQPQTPEVLAHINIIRNMRNRLIARKEGKVITENDIDMLSNFLINKGIPLDLKTLKELLTAFPRIMEIISEHLQRFLINHVFSPFGIPESIRKMLIKQIEILLKNINEIPKTLILALKSKDRNALVKEQIYQILNSTFITDELKNVERFFKKVPDIFGLLMSDLKNTSSLNKNIVAAFDKNLSKSLNDMVKMAKENNEWQSGAEVVLEDIRNITREIARLKIINEQTYNQIQDTLRNKGPEGLEDVLVLIIGDKNHAKKIMTLPMKDAVPYILQNISGILSHKLLPNVISAAKAEIDDKKEEPNEFETAAIMQLTKLSKEMAQNTSILLGNISLEDINQMAKTVPNIIGSDLRDEGIIALHNLGEAIQKEFPQFKPLLKGLVQFVSNIGSQMTSYDHPNDGMTNSRIDRPNSNPNIIPFVSVDNDRAEFGSPDPYRNPSSNRRPRSVSQSFNKYGMQFTPEQEARLALEEQKAAQSERMAKDMAEQRANIQREYQDLLKNTSYSMPYSGANNISENNKEPGLFSPELQKEIQQQMDQMVRDRDLQQRVMDIGGRFQNKEAKLRNKEEAARRTNGAVRAADEKIRKIQESKKQDQEKEMDIIYPGISAIVNNPNLTEEEKAIKEQEYIDQKELMYIDNDLILTPEQKERHKQKYLQKRKPINLRR